MHATVLALPYAALVIDRAGRIRCANRQARQSLGGAAPETLAEALAAGQESALERLTRSARSTVPAFVRLSFAGACSHLFRVSALRLPGDGGAGLLLLVADNPGPVKARFVEMRHGTHALNRQIARDRHKREALRAEAARLRELSETDALTGLLNLRAFEARMRDALASPTGRAGALVFLDLNDFKRVNDCHGHAVGDGVLRHVAERLIFPPRLRILSARVGGDEFVLWLPGIEAAALPGAVAEIRARVAMPCPLHDDASAGQQVQVTAAIGTARFPREATTLKDLRQIADKRMYDDKTSAAISARTAGPRA